MKFLILETKQITFKRQLLWNVGGTQLGNEQLTLKLVLKWIQIAQGYQLILMQIVILVIDAVTKK